MKAILFSMLIIFLCLFNANAQKEKFKVNSNTSEIIKKSPFNLNYVVQLNENEYLNIFMLRIFKINANLEIIQENELPKEYLKKNITYVSLQKMGSQYLAYFTLYDKKKEEMSLYQIAIDKTTLKWSDNPVLIGSVYQNTGNFYNEGEFFFSKSKNNQMLLITGVHASKKTDGLKAKLEVSKGENTLGEISCSFWVLDQELKTINSRDKFIINRGLSVLEFKNFACDNTGNVAMNVYDQIVNSLNANEGESKITLYIHRVYFFDLKGNNKEFKTDKKIRLGSSCLSFSPNGEYLDFVSIAIGSRFYYSAIGTYALRIKISDFSTEYDQVRYFDADDFLDKTELSKIDKNEEFAISGLSNMLDIYYDKEENVNAIMEKRAVQPGVENNPSVYHYSDIIIETNLNSEEEENQPIIIKRDIYKTNYVEKGAGVLFKSENLFIWSGSKVYKINFEEKSYKVAEIIDSEYETKLKTRKNTNVLMESRMPSNYIIINNTKGLGKYFSYERFILKSINIDEE